MRFALALLCASAPAASGALLDRVLGASEPRNFRPSDDVSSWGRRADAAPQHHHHLASVGELLKDDLSHGGEPADPTLKKLKDEWEKKMESAKEKGKKVTRPLMSAINAMRADLCWARPELWSHQKCIKFLGLICSTSSTGHGTCRNFIADAAKHCAKVETEVQEKTCDALRKLNIIQELDEEKEELEEELSKEEQKEAEADAEASKKAEEKKSDMDGDGIPDDEDSDIDNDGTENEKDKFPRDKNEWSDIDGDGIGDNSDSDMDGDGAPNEHDNFPRDPTEWNDLDADGIGDNSDHDRDGDGAPNDVDKYPDDPTRQGDGKDEPIPMGNDRDKDGVVDSMDAFPDDPKEWGDLDKDGIGDNSDEDIDGDGHNNDKDAYPRDPNKFMHDRDGDGVADDEDVFPDDAAEWKDSDKDGVGDNADYAPHDANCQTNPCPGEETDEAEESESEGDAEPAEEDEEEEEKEEEEEEVPKRTWADKLNKVERGLPPDGYDEHTPGLVEHEDMETMTHDWMKEWPRLRETEEETMKRICAEEPDNTWCIRHGFSS